MWSNQANICGILVVGVWATIPMKQSVDSSRGNQKINWSLEVHRIKIIKFRCLWGIWWRNNTWSKCCCFSKIWTIHNEYVCPTLREYSHRKYSPFLLMTKPSSLQNIDISKFGHKNYITSFFLVFVLFLFLCKLMFCVFYYSGITMSNSKTWILWCPVGKESGNDVPTQWYETFKFKLSSIFNTLEIKLCVFLCDYFLYLFYASLVLPQQKIQIKSFSFFTYISSNDFMVTQQSKVFWYCMLIVFTTQQ
jgi:hypothetical protein